MTRTAFRFRHARGQARRILLSALAAASLLTPASLPAASFELNLKLDQSLKDYHDEEAPVALEAQETNAETQALKFSPRLANPTQSKTIVIDSDTPQSNASSAADSTSALTLLIRLLWLTTSVFLFGHVAREWARVILVRLRREHKPMIMEHANWPVATILVVPKGDAPSQEHRLDVLRSLPFDYPPERIHFVVAYHLEDLGVRDAIHRLGKALPERVQPLPIEPGDDGNLATLLPQALTKSVGSALVVLDLHLPVPRDWLKQAISPLLDPAVGAVLNRTIPGQAHNALATRLIALTDHADVLLATQSDAIELMLCGKARVRALRRSAYKRVVSDASALTPDGASIVLDLVRTGWQAVLLADVHSPEPHMSLDTIRSPRLHPSVSLRALRLAPLAITRSYPRGARLQGRAAFFSAALPLIWLGCLISGLLLYMLGDILCGGLAIGLCAATSFDPLGHPRPAFSVAAAARMAGLREEIRLLPLACASFIDRMVEGCRVSLQVPRRKPSHTLEPGDPVLFHKEESA